MNEEIFPQSTLTVTTSFRPKRVAFLVNPEETNEDELNEIFSYCQGVWGGGYNIIIPATSKEIAHDWWKLFVSIDPDIVYSFLELDDYLIERINRHILPSKIIEITPARKEQRGSSIDPFEIRALGIEDIPRFMWANRGIIREPHFFYIKKSWKKTPYLSFILRNFGILPDVLAMNEAFHGVPHEIIDASKGTANEIFNKLLPIAERCTIPADLCQLYAAPHFAFKQEPFFDGFHLVVGDHPLDVIYHWNHSLTSRQYNGRDTLWLSEEQCSDTDLLQLVGKWIQKTFWAQNRYGKIISYSVDKSKLKALADTMKGIVNFGFKIEVLRPDRYPSPDGTHLLKLGMAHQTEQVSMSENQGLVGFQRPLFLFKGHPQFGWMVDLEIQYHPERYAIYTNARPNWQLPKRLGLAQKFFDYKMESRIVKGGQVSVAVTTEDRTIKFKVPSDLDVVWTYLDKRYTNIDRKRSSGKARFTDLYVSDKGRYLQGLLRLFGSIYGVCHFFEDPFWRHILLLMAGVNNSAKKTSNSCPECGKEIEKTIETNGKPLTIDNIKHAFGELRGKALKEDSKDNNYWQIYDRFDDLKESDLRYLIDKRVLLQGIDLRCPHCYTHQWCVVDDLGTEMRCNGCLLHFPLPTAPKWSFRLNDLVGNALRKHGTLAVLQTLYNLQQFKGMFLYLPCQDIFEDEQRDCFTDLDIVVITDEKFIVGEVKSATNGFKAKDFEKLLEVAKELVPDQVILAAPGNEWPEEAKLEIQKFSETLVPFEVEVLPYLLWW